MTAHVHQFPVRNRHAAVRRTHPFHLGHLIALVVLLLIAAATAWGAETDPYYGWFHPPHDGRAGINEEINRQLGVGLDDVNRVPPSSCREAAAGMTSRLAATAAWFWAGSTRFWRVDRSPRTRTEYEDRYRRESTYRDTMLLPFGSMVPLDPTVRVGDVLFGTDKLGHFFTDGFRYYVRYARALDEGKSKDDAERLAIATGVDEEKTYLGVSVSGIFSYADLETNWRGFEFFRGLCDGDNPALTKTASGKWRLTRAFQIEQWVDPCWDEGYDTSWFAPQSQNGVLKAIQSSCDRWTSSAEVAARRKAYDARGCSSKSIDMLSAMIAKGDAPDPRPFSIDHVCGTSARVSVKAGRQLSGADR